jgi:ComF family protein
MHETQHKHPAGISKEQIAYFLRHYISFAMTLVFPPQCGSCKQPVDQPHSVCSDCFEQLEFISDPRCACCGIPFDYAIEEDGLCGGCLSHTPPFTFARSALRYNDASRRLVTRLKYADKLHLVPLLGGYMHYADPALFTGADYIIPVPLHWRRRIKRKYNQSQLLAGHIAKKHRLSLLADGLLRTKHTPPQAGLSRVARLRNVAGAFTVNPKRASLLERKTVILTDDVFTTGATIEACCKALKKAGAKEVRVLTLARRVLSE